MDETTIDIVELQKQRDKQRFLAYNIPSKENWINFGNTRNKLKKKIKDTKAAFYKKTLTSKNSKEIWKIVHRILNPSDKTLEADTNELNKYFNQTGKLLTTTKPHSNDELKYLIRSFPDKNNGFQMQAVSYGDVAQCLRLLRNGCSTRYDNIPATFIKPVVELLVSPLTFVINNYLATSNFPNAWKTAAISPVPKLTQPVELKDYRRVSIFPVLSEVYEKLVLQQLAVFIERKSVCHQYQSDHRKNHSTTTLLLKLHDDIKKAMKSSEVTIAIFTDYSKAFDTIDFSILLKKMHTLNFSKHFLYWIFNYLTDRRHFAQIDSSISNILIASFWRTSRIYTWTYPF